MAIPDEVRLLKLRIQEQVENFFSRHAPESSNLILDSTGPSLTKHYIVLQCIGQERLLRFKEVHAYSGGVWAYFGFLALINGKANYRYEEFGDSKVESAMRRFHHPRPWGGLRAVTKLVTGKSAFGSVQPLTDLLKFYFEEAYLLQPLNAFSPNLKIYIGRKGHSDPSIIAGTSEGELREFSTMSAAELISIATKVPFVYGQPNRDDTWFDAAYTPGYLNSLRAASKDAQATLVSTPWKSGQKGGVAFVNCFGSRNPRLSMASDFAKLILNIPNKTFGHDIAGAFL
jgi:hypothetical protein